MRNPVEILWSDRADDDLAAIVAFIRQYSEDFPQMGRVSDLHLEHEYRELVVGTVKVFYRLEGHQVLIVRVWDVRRDPSTFSI
jgi:plasmid stabilization system protein ParE